MINLPELPYTSSVLASPSYEDGEEPYVSSNDGYSDDDMVKYANTTIIQNAEVLWEAFISKLNANSNKNRKEAVLQVSFLGSIASYKKVFLGAAQELKDNND